MCSCLIYLVYSTFFVTCIQVNGVRTVNSPAVTATSPISQSVVSATTLSDLNITDQFSTISTTQSINGSEVPTSSASIQPTKSSPATTNSSTTSSLVPEVEETNNSTDGLNTSVIGTSPNGHQTIAPTSETLATVSLAPSEALSSITTSVGLVTSDSKPLETEIESAVLSTKTNSAVTPSSSTKQILPPIASSVAETSSFVSESTSPGVSESTQSLPTQNIVSSIVPTTSDTTSMVSSIVPTASSSTSAPVTSLQTSASSSAVIQSSIILSTTPFSSTRKSPQKDKVEAGGLSTGGKVALGIFIPVIIIGLLIVGILYYRRHYRSGQWGLSSSVAYKPWNRSDEESLRFTR